MTSDEIEVSERAEAALKTNAEAYRLAQEAVDMRTERDAARAENERLRAERDELIRHKDTNECTRYGHRWKDAFGPAGALCQCGEWIFAVHAADCRPATEAEKANPRATRPIRRENVLIGFDPDDYPEDMGR